MPLSGWLYDSASGLRPFHWYGLVDMPKLSAPNEGLAELSNDAHELLFWVLVALVVMHAAAAFYHHMFQTDATLTRMLPRKDQTPSRPYPRPTAFRVGRWPQPYLRRAPAPQP